MKAEAVGVFRATDSFLSVAIGEISWLLKPSVDPRALPASPAQKR